ncbi:MAG TPA: beta-ketoacyl synthase chain length factor [Usitatibacter sp.]|nr:beta-ketoacyl synthase chain length factor [Usitatibacter sp.]
MSLALRIEGVGLVGPGLASWEAAREVLAGRAAYEPAKTVIPAPEALPTVERRRAGRCVRMAIAVGLAATSAARRSAKALAAIFASSGADGENLHAICEALASDDRLISPTRFHNSVNNAPAGYWGIATGSMLPSDCIAAYDGTFAAGLLEAAGRLAAEPNQPLMLAAYDGPYPEPLNATRPMSDCFGVAFVLAAGEGAGPRLSLETSREPVTPMQDARLEPVRLGCPAARCLPLLALLASEVAGHVALEYLDDTSLYVRVAP